MYISLKKMDSLGDRIYTSPRALPTCMSSSSRVGKRFRSNFKRKLKSGEEKRFLLFGKSRDDRMGSIVLAPSDIFSMELNNFWIWIWRRGSKICIGGETAVCVYGFPSHLWRGPHTQSAVSFFLSKKSYRRFSLLCFRPLQLVLYHHHHSSFLPNLVPCQIGTIAAHRRPSLSVYNKFLCVYVVLRESADSLVIYNSNNNIALLIFCCCVYVPLKYSNVCAI